VSALRGVATGLESRVWAWTYGESGAAAALPLRQGAAERALATNLQSVLGRRLSWGRDDEGRALGTVGLTTEDRAPEEGDRRLWVRFVTIQQRTVLAVGTSGEALDRAPEILATIDD
jgi:hypothetical protein